MIYRFFRKKRVFALLLIVFLLFLFYNNYWMRVWVYPIEYEDQIRVTAKAQDVDPLLIAAIIRAESNYSEEKVSKKGAVGLMQVMPDTANWVAANAGYEVPLGDRLFDPEVNIHIGTLYVQTLIKQLGNERESDRTSSDLDRLALIAASYNAGPGSVGKWLESGTWTGNYKDVSMIPFGETRHFVERIVYYLDKYERYHAALRDE